NEGVFRKVEDAGTTTFAIAYNGLKTASTEIKAGTLSLIGGGKDVGPVDLDAGAEILCSGGYLLDGADVSGAGVCPIHWRRKGPGRQRREDRQPPDGRRRAGLHRGRVYL